LKFDAEIQALDQKMRDNTNAIDTASSLLTTLAEQTDAYEEEIRIEQEAAEMEAAAAWHTAYEQSKADQELWLADFTAKKAEFDTQKGLVDAMPDGAEKTAAQEELATAKREMQTAQVKADQFQKANAAFAA
jgi:hypothetical protein